MNGFPFVSISKSHHQLEMVISSNAPTLPAPVIFPNLRCFRTALWAAAGALRRHGDDGDEQRQEHREDATDEATGKSGGKIWENIQLKW